MHSIERILRRKAQPAYPNAFPEGLILVTGPTSRGKTTTLDELMRTAPYCMTHERPARG